MKLWTKIALGAAAVGLIAGTFGYQKLSEYLMTPLMLTMVWWLIKRDWKKSGERKECQNCLNINPRYADTCNNCGSNALVLVQT